MNIRSLVY